ncbi:MAG: hypothetical protein WCE21_01830 [Candidatus Babeliales bacterium]
MNRIHLIFAIITSTSFMHTSVFSMLIKQDPVLAAIKYSNVDKFKSAFNNQFPNFPIDDNNPKKQQIVKQKHKPALDEAKKQALQTLNNHTFLDNHRKMILAACGVGGVLLGYYALKTFYCGSIKISDHINTIHKLSADTVGGTYGGRTRVPKELAQIMRNHMLAKEHIENAVITLGKMCIWGGIETVLSGAALSKAYQAYHSKWYKNNATEIVEILDTITPTNGSQQNTPSIDLIDLSINNNNETMHPTDETESN